MTRREFRSFLARVTAGQVAVEDWNRYAVQHYQDQELEAARCELVREALFRGQCCAQTIPDGLDAVAEELLARLSAEEHD